MNEDDHPFWWDEVPDVDSPVDEWPDDDDRVSLETEFARGRYE